MAPRIEESVQTRIDRKISTCGDQFIQRDGLILMCTACEREVNYKDLGGAGTMIRQHCKTITHVTNIKNAGLIQVWNTSSETPVRSRRPKTQRGGDSGSNGQENGQENDSFDGSSTDEGSFLGNNGTTSTLQTDAEMTLVQTLNIPDGPESVPSSQTTPVEVSSNSSLPARAPPTLPVGVTPALHVRVTPASSVRVTPAFVSSERNGKEPERNSGQNDDIDWSSEEEEHEDDIDYEIKVLMADKLRAEAKFYQKANQTFDIAAKVGLALVGVTLAALCWLIHQQIHLWGSLFGA